MWVWAAVECNLGVICGCVPALRPLLSKVTSLATSKGSTDNSKKSRSNGKWSLVTIGSVGLRQQQNGNRHKGPHLSTDVHHHGDYLELDHVALRSAAAEGSPDFADLDYPADARRPHASGRKPHAPVVTTTLDISTASSDLEKGDAAFSPFPLPPSRQG